MDLRRSSSSLKLSAERVPRRAWRVIRRRRRLAAERIPQQIIWRACLRSLLREFAAKEIFRNTPITAPVSRLLFLTTCHVTQIKDLKKQ